MTQGDDDANSEPRTVQGFRRVTGTNYLALAGFSAPDEEEDPPPANLASQ